jgi:hypothetical protein
MGLGIFVFFSPSPCVGQPDASRLRHHDFHVELQQLHVGSRRDTVAGCLHSWPVSLGSLISAGQNNPSMYPQMLAGSVIVSAPLIVIFFALQRFVLQGINIGGVKE